MFMATIEIKLKKGVVDPEGKNIKKALNLLHFREVKDAQISRIIKLKITLDTKEKAQKRSEEMCRKLLANPVINEYNITIEDWNE